MFEKGTLWRVAVAICWWKSVTGWESGKQTAMSPPALTLPWYSSCFSLVVCGALSCHSLVSHPGVRGTPWCLSLVSEVLPGVSPWCMCVCGTQYCHFLGICRRPIVPTLEKREISAVWPAVWWTLLKRCWGYHRGHWCCDQIKPNFKFESPLVNNFADISRVGLEARELVG